MVKWATAVFVVCATALAAFQLYAAYSIDKTTQAISEKIVSNGIDLYRRDLAGKLHPQTFWDDAVIHLDNRFDPKWAKIFIGDYFRQSEGFDTVLIVRSDGGVLFAEEGGKRVQPERLDRIMAAAQPIIRDIRRGETQRGPLAAGIPDSVRLPPVSSNAIEDVNGSVQILAGSLVQPDRRARVSARAPIVIVAKRFDAAMVNTVGERFLLSSPSLKRGPLAADEPEASVPLLNRAGKPVASLQWVPHEPGSVLLARTLPALLVFALVLGSLIAAMILHARQLAKDLVSSERRAIRLAYRDTLTDLPNRARIDEAFSSIAQNDLADGKGFAVLLIDLDQFKAVNDSLGHQAGDSLIRVVARRISDHCRPSDFLARFGGDEFILILSGANPTTAPAIAARLIDDICRPIDLDVGRVFVGASVGIAMVDDASVDAQEAVRRADLALYAAKEAGRNCARLFDPSMDRRVRVRQDLRVRLHQAILDGQLAVHYQPQVDIDGRVIGLEALARWFVPELGEVEPSLFVQVAEESGLIDDLGFFVIRRAFEDSRQWPSLPVAINVSAFQLRSGPFVDQVSRLAAQCAIDPSQFEFEITEGILLGDDVSTRATLDRLRALGFRIVLDDFGTGYSSLGYLQRYPIDKIKIDRAFVGRLEVDPQGVALVVAIVQLAQAFSLEVVAEGVETAAQRDWLCAAGCKHFQGFLTGHPMPADDLLRFLSGSEEAHAQELA